MRLSPAFDRPSPRPHARVVVGLTACAAQANFAFHWLLKKVGHHPELVRIRIRTRWLVPGRSAAATRRDTTPLLCRVSVRADRIILIDYHHGLSYCTIVLVIMVDDSGV